jgi:hypothetical protein
MIPLLIGAAAVGLGAALMSDDKPKEEAVTQNKIHLTDKQVERRLNSAGRRIKTVGEETPNYPSSSGMHFIPSGDFSEDFGKIENMLDSPNIGDEFIDEALGSIEKLAMRNWNDQALNFVAYYREKLRNRATSNSQGISYRQSSDNKRGNSNTFNDSFKRIDNMFARNMSTYQIKNELQVIELTAKNRRDVAAMNELAVYYERIGAYERAWHCRESAKIFP